MIRLFKVSIPLSVIGLLTTEPALLLACYVLACYWELGREAVTYLNDDNGIARSAVLALAFVFGAYLTDLYEQVRVRSWIALISQVMSILGAALIFEAVIGFLNPDWALPKEVVLTGSVWAMVAVSGWRILYSIAIISAVGTQKILFLGSGPLMSTLAAKLQKFPEIGIRPIGYLADHKPLDVEFPPCVGDVDDVMSVVSRLKPDRVIISTADRRGHLPMQDLLDLRFSGVLIEEATVLYEEVTGRICVDEIRPSHLILSSHLGPRRWTVRLQTIYATIFAVVAFVLTLPLLLLAALTVKLTSRGPVLYSQTRVGLNGEPFRVYKLRSMYQDAEARTGAVWASENDPRIIPVGRFLRKSRLDEIPQLINVLKGEMTIVGPRPERPEFVRKLEQLIPYYRQRHCVKPGITGWAQINHQYSDDFENTKAKLEYDLYYIKNLSPSLDAYIMFQTLKIMMLTRGAR
jgi:sugar transferase (PEP-CTERM system associated)